MKIQRSDMGRFLQLVRKTWKSNNEVDSQAVVCTVIESGYSIAMEKDGLLLTYLCNQVDLEISEQSIAMPLAFVLEYSTENGMVELHEAIENGEGYIIAKWFEGYVQSERRWPARDAPQYHLLQDLAWHTIDERQLIMQGLSQLATVTIASH